MKPFQPKPKACAHCGNSFLPLRAMQQVCGPLCAARKVKQDRAAAKVALKARKAALKRTSDYKAEAQKSFNDFIRARDAHLPCVSCGVIDPPMKPGGQWDAGHFLGRGAYPELAFNEDNCWRQCKSCNAGSGKFSHKARTVAEKYEAELLNRIGPERLAALKGPHPPNQYRKADYEAIRETYRLKRKELESK
jgi:hypothetical protein